MDAAQVVLKPADAEFAGEEQGPPNTQPGDVEITDKELDELIVSLQDQEQPAKRARLKEALQGRRAVP